MIWIRPVHGCEELFTLGVVREIVNALSQYSLEEQYEWCMWFRVSTGQYVGKARFYGRIRDDVTAVDG